MSDVDRITPELLAWAARKAARYAARFGDHDGLYEPAAVEGLWRAQRTYEGRHPGGFDGHARRAVVQALNGQLRRSGPRGYRHDPRPGFSGNRLGAPGSVRIDAGDFDGLADRGALPVGWEVESEDAVEAIAARLPRAEAEVVRLCYLRCEGGSFGRAGRVLGKAPGTVKQYHDSAVRRIRRRVAPDGRRPAPREVTP